MEGSDESIRSGRNEKDEARRSGMRNGHEMEMRLLSVNMFVFCLMRSETENSVD